MWKLGGFLNCTAEVRVVFITLSTMTFPCEAIVWDLWEDDCGLRRAKEFQATMQEELDYLIQLPIYCWERMAEATQDKFSADYLKGISIAASIKSIGYFCWDSLASLESFPPCNQII